MFSLEFLKNCLILFLDSLIYLVGILVFVFLGFVFMTFVCDVCFFAFSGLFDFAFTTCLRFCLTLKIFFYS